MTTAERWGSSRSARFLNSPAGRLVRMVAGIALISWGYALGGGTAGIVLFMAGLIPLSAGIFDLCFISALLGGPINARSARKPRSGQVA